MANTFGRLRCARLGAAACLPAALLSVALAVLPAPARATQNVTMDTRLVRLRSEIEKGAQVGGVTLYPYDGAPLSGAFAGFIGDWRELNPPEPRYAAWLADAHGPAPGLGDAIVVARVSGDTLRGAFEGVGNSQVLLRLGAGPAAVPVSFSKVLSVRGAADEDFGGWGALRERWSGAPSTIAVALDQGPFGTIVVSRTRIASARAHTNDPDDSGRRLSVSRATVVAVLAGVATAVVCVVIVQKQLDDAASNCTFPSSTPFGVDRRFGAATVSAPRMAPAHGATPRP